MKTKTKSQEHPLPTVLTHLIRMMPPMVIRDEVQHANYLEVIDRLMQIQRLSAGQAAYLETLVQLVEAYESKQHAIDVSTLSGLDMLKHVLAESGLSASALARLLGVHPTMGSKLIHGERRLTWDHAKILAKHFRLAPAVFMD